MIDVTHDGHYWRTWRQLILNLLHRFVQECIWIIQFRRKGFMTHFFHQNHGGVLIQHLVNRHHLPHAHQNFDQLRGFNRHFMR